MDGCITEMPKLLIWSENNYKKKKKKKKTEQKRDGRNRE
jgi:hypothetical protein